ncbi:hypothetical protein FHX37_1707 [Haloactinospora alba]|uniref:Uncharacterized protein n=1 Tax=Haloactinospora alba TaxID=405555 RepID=A0A543NIY8_9ACTN|nr:hypothetical protein [Haloactinospora alba]TQN31786.1 hypothetical protein FHX37_1707 [Haloactinospora alba]
MTVETPPSGMAGMAGYGSFLDENPVDTAWLQALSSLTVELRSWGLEARMDGVVGAVDAIAHMPVRRSQRVVLRPHRGRLWWWLRWSEYHSATAPLTPVGDTRRASRRIVRVLELP